MVLFKNQNVKIKLALIICTLLLGFSVIGYIFWTTLSVNKLANQSITELNNTLVQVYRIDENIQRARKLEKMYLLERDIKYTEEHTVVINNTLALIDGLKKSLANETVLLSVARELGNYITEYHAGFKSVVDAKIKRFATIEEFKQLVNKIQSGVFKTDNKILINSFLKMRNYEKDYLATRDYQFVTNMNNEMKQFALLLFDIEMSDEERNILSKLTNEYNLTLLALTNGTATVDKRISEFTSIVNKIEPALARIINGTNEHLSINSQLINSKIVKQKNIFTITLLIVGLVTLIIISKFFKYLAESLRIAADIMCEITNGNLTNNVISRSNDEVGILLSSLDDMQSKLQQVISNIRSTTNEVTNSTEQVYKGNLQLSQRTQQQASSLEEIASSLEQMTSTVQHNAENAQQVSKLAEQAMEKANEGEMVVNQTIRSMTEIESASNRITDIINVIDEIAFQTNLLALNAAVEAARAGEQGRGFAVVANEVRNLSGRCASAAKDIKDLIDNTVIKIQHGTKLVNESGHVLKEIVTSSKQVSENTGQIAIASKEQSSGITQVNKAITEMDEITQHNAALVEEIAASSDAMKLIALELNNSVDYFKLSFENRDNNSVVQTPASSNELDAKKNYAHTPESKTRMNGNGKLENTRTGNMVKSTIPVENQIMKANLVDTEELEWQEF